MKILKLTIACASFISILVVGAILLIERNDYHSFTDLLNKLDDFSEPNLGLVGPVEVVSMTLFADGGSIEVSLKDYSGTRVDLFYDQSGEYPKDNRYLYVGQYSEFESARKVPLGSNVENEMLSYVSGWMSERFPDYRNKPDMVITFPETSRIINYGAIAAFVRDLERRNAQK